MGRRARDDLRRGQQRLVVAQRAARVEKGWGVWSDEELNSISGLLGIFPGEDYTRAEIRNMLAQRARAGLRGAIMAFETLGGDEGEFAKKLVELEAKALEFEKANGGRLDRERQILAARQQKIDAAAGLERQQQIRAARQQQIDAALPPPTL